MEEQPEFKHPFDTPLSGGLRFVVELIAWVAGPWAIADASVLAAVPAAVILMGVPAIFSTQGDKRQVFISTPGPLRVVLELVLHGVAIAGAWLVWPPWLGLLVTVTVIAAPITGRPRIRWLLQGAAT